MKPSPTPHEIHLGIAEQGKLMALKGDHREALRHYREAIRLAVSGKAPEIFFRHYTQCVLESLEHSESYDEVIRFCTDADAHYRKLNVTDDLHRRDHGSILERAGIVHLKAGRTEVGRAALEKAVQVAGADVLPLAEEVLRWLSRGYAVDRARLHSAQQRHGQYVVRKEKVDKRIARQLPKRVGETPAVL